MHVPEYFSITGNTLLKTSDEGPERTIKQYDQHSKRFNLKMTKNMTSGLKLKRDHSQMSSFNALAKSRMESKRQKALFSYKLLYYDWLYYDWLYYDWLYYDWLYYDWLHYKWLYYDCLSSNQLDYDGLNYDMLDYE